MSLRCDGAALGCSEAVAYECVCSRCAREQDAENERFHACEEHQREASMRHERVRGCLAKWERRVQ